MNDLETKKKKLLDLIDYIELLQENIDVFKNYGLAYKKEARDLESCLVILEDNKQNCPEFFV